MKDSSGPCKTTATLPESVRRHLNRLAIVMSLTAVGLFALASPADAKIVYTAVNITIGANSSYNLDVNNDGITDFTISTSLQKRPYYCGDEPTWLFRASVDETPASGDGAEGSPPAALSKGEQIGPDQSYYVGQGTLSYYYNSWGPPPRCDMINNYSGDWTQSAHYLGLALQINGETYYGWAHLKVDVKYATASFTLTGYAYENTPGMPINAGQKTDTEDESALSPGSANASDSSPCLSLNNPAQAASLGKLTLGAPEVPLLRRREPAGVAPENS